jgi:predicted XRE-type DNA-binding protein
MSRKPVSTRGSGNAFADLGMADPDTRLAKARLAQKITAIMHEQNLTQQQIAEMLDVDQPQVSRITRGQLKDFSLEKLMALVNRLNMDIEISVTPNPESARRAHLIVRDHVDGVAAAGEGSQPERFRFD